MGKLENLKRHYNCDLCQEMLIDPVALPCCGHFVCQRHVKNFAKKIKCMICQDSYQLPKGGLAVNKRMKSGLDVELDSLRAEPIYEECGKLLDELERSAVKLQTVIIEPEEFLNDHFEKIKNKIISRGMSLKDSIDEYSIQLIQSVEAIKANSIESVKQEERRTQKNRIELFKLTTQVEKSKDELDNLKEEFNKFSTEFDSIKASADSLRINFDQMLVKYTELLLENKEYSFASHEDSHDLNDLLINKVFGFLETKPLERIVKVIFDVLNRSFLFDVFIFDIFVFRMKRWNRLSMFFLGLT